jgi:hypothetical protein
MGEVSGRHGRLLKQLRQADWNALANTWMRSPSWASCAAS